MYSNTNKTKATIILSLVFSFVLVSLSESFTAKAEATLQEKGISILNNVLGLDLTKYTVTINEIPAELQLPYFDVLPMKDIGYDLTSEESKVKTLFTFVDGNLQTIHVLETEGPPSLTTPATSTNAAEMAEDFLRSYQIYTADSLYGELKDTLVNLDASENSTETFGNMQLEVSAVDGYTTFKWTYTFNGVTAPSKVVALGFKNGFLNYFVDNWNLYRIGSTNISLSKDEAVAIALETARAYNWSMEMSADTLDPENFNESNVRWTSLIFDDSVGAGKARSEDLLTLYPVWRVGIALDKWHGNMYGIEVDIWADTKEIRRIQEAWSTMPPPEGNSSTPPSGGDEPPIPEFPSWIILPLLITATLLILICKHKLPKKHQLA